MSSHKSRLAKLEAEHAPETDRYVCIVHPDQEGQGYDVSHFAAGVRTDEKIHFNTRAELDAFEARSDVDLLIVEIVYVSQEKKEE